MKASVMDRRKFLTVAATTLGTITVAPEKVGAQGNGINGLLVRGADGEIYFIPADKMSAFNVAPNKVSEIGKKVNIPKNTSRITGTELKRLGLIASEDSRAAVILDIKAAAASFANPNPQNRKGPNQNK